MFGYEREDAPCDALNIARSKMLGKHRSDDLVAGFATDGGSVFAASENRMRTEEWRRYKSGHDDVDSSQKSEITIYEMGFSPSMARRFPIFGYPKPTCKIADSRRNRPRSLPKAGSPASGLACLRSLPRSGVAVRKRSSFVQGRASDSPAGPGFRTADRPENRADNPELASGFELMRAKDSRQNKLFPHIKFEAQLSAISIAEQYGAVRESRRRAAFAAREDAAQPGANLDGSASRRTARGGPAAPVQPAGKNRLATRTEAAAASGKPTAGCRSP